MIDDPMLASVKSEPVDIPSKKAKVLEDYSNAIDFHRQLMMLRQQQLPFLSAWPLPPPLPGSAVKGGHPSALPYNLPQFSSDQFTEPPVLQNPERVVRLSDGQRFETNFQPNVALAPRKQNIIKESPKESLPPPPLPLTNALLSSPSPVPPAQASLQPATTGLLLDRECGGVSHRSVPLLSSSAGGNTAGVIAVIKQEPEIKEEPPSTPPDITQSPEPRYSPPGTITAVSIQTTGAIPMVVGGGGGAASPGEVSQSGSNEITSSTSPVPAISHATSSSLLPLSDNSTTSTNKQEPLSPAAPTTPTPPRKSTDSTNSIQRHHHHHHNHHHHRSQMSPMVVHKNGTCPVTTHGSELELSTDTDDESIAGEPDSSCVTFDLSGDILKDVRPEQRDKLLGFIKMLIAESSQAKQLRHELRSRDEQIEQLLQENKILRKRLEQYESHAATMTAPVSAEAQMATTAVTAVTQQHPQQIQSSVIARPDLTKNDFETTTTTAATTTMGTKLVNGFTEKSATSEYIIKPLKKSLRRSPEDTVVIMQPKRDEIKIVTNGELVPSVN